MNVNMLSDFLKKEYGKKLYKLLLSSGMTCPNRDGKCGIGGCIFCSGSGSGEYTQKYDNNISRQIERAKADLSDKERQCSEFIAYFQAFSNTYDTPENLRKLYLPVVNRDDIAVLDIATRPDCLDDNVLEVLSQLNSIKPLWIELGLQTINENTAEYIRRGYSLSVYEEAVRKLRDRGIKVITHLILGLPHESKEDMINSARFAGKCSDGLKFHALLVLKDTDLEKDYREGKFNTLTREEYIDILCDCIRNVPENVVIHRLTSDSDNNNLVSPLWTLNKPRVLREISNAFYDKDIFQGEYHK